MKTVKLRLVIAVVALLLIMSGNALANTKLILWDWWDARGALYQEMADRYREIRPDVEIVVEVSGWDEFWTKLALAASTGVGPDLTEFHNEQYAAFAGYLAPFPSDLFPMDEMAQEYIHFDQAFNFDGNFYYMPGGIMTGGIFYNKDLLAAAGVGDVPTTWDGVVDVAKQLTRITGDGEMQQAGLSANDMGLLLDLLYQNGGFLFGESGVTWDEDPGRAAAVQLAEIMLSGVSNTPERPIAGDLASGHAAMQYVWTHYGGYLRQQDIDWDVAIMPTKTGDNLPARGRSNYESGLAVMASTAPDRQRMAFEFIKWIHEDDDFIVRLNTLIGRIPARMSTWHHPELIENPVMRMLIEQAPYTVFAGPIPGWTWGPLYDAWEAIVTGRKAPEVAIEESAIVGNAFFKEEPPMWIVEREYAPPTN